MQKKILLSIAMSGAATLPALADVELLQFMQQDISNNGWKPSGMEKPDFETNPDGIVCGVAVGNVVKTVNLPQGKYTFTFNGLKNAVVKIDGKTVNADKDGNISYALTLSAAKDVTVEVSPKVAGVYSFEDFSLVLNADIEAIHTALVTEFNKISYTKIEDKGTNVLADDVKALDERKAALKVRQNAIDAKIVNISLSDGGAADKYFGNLKYYAEYQLWATPNVVAKELADLQTDVNAYNADVNALNTRFSNYATNVADRDNYATQYEVFVASWNAINTKVQGFDKENEYLQKLAAASTTANNNIKAFKDLYDKTYGEGADLFAAPNKELGKMANSIDAELKTLKTNVDNAGADQAAWNKFFGENVKAFDAAYRADVTAVGAITGVTTAPDGTTITETFSKFKADEITKIDEVYKDINTNYVDPYRNKIEGFNKIFTDNSLADKLTAAEGDMKKSADAAVAEANSQKALYNAACNTYRNKKNVFNNLPAVSEIPANYQKEYQEKVAAANDALKALNDYYVQQIEAMTLTSDGANGLISAFDNAVDEVNNFLTIDNPVVYLTNKLENTQKNIATSAELAYLTGEYYVDVNSKFTTTYESIKAAIDEVQKLIDDKKSPNELRDQIIKSIDDVADNANTIITSFESAKNSLDKFNREDNLLNNWTATKIVLPEAEKAEKIDAIRADYLNELNDSLTNFKAQYKAAALVEGYACVKAAEGVKDHVDTYNPTAKCLDAQTALIKDISVANHDYVIGEVNSSKALAAQYKFRYQNLGGLGFGEFLDNFEKVYDDVEKELDKILPDYNTMLNKSVSSVSSSYQSGWNAVDKKYQTALGHFAEAQAEFNKLVANLEAFDELGTEIDDLRAAVTKTTTDFVANCPTDAAKTHFNGKVSNISSQISTLDYRITNAARQLTAADQKEAFDEEVVNIHTSITDLQTEITANTKNYNTLFNEALDIRKDVDNKIATLEDAQKYNQEAVAENIAALKQIRDVDLYKYNQEILDATNKGELASNETYSSFSGQLENITKAADSAFMKGTNEYNQNVARVNGQKYTAWKNNELSAAQDTYTNAVKAFTDYENISNYGLKKALNVEENSSDIYPYNALIRQTNTNFGNLINELNRKNPALVISPAQIKVFNDSLTKYETAINTKLTEVNNEMNPKAKGYYATLDAKANTEYNSAKATLEAQGIPTNDKSVFNTVTLALKQAEKSYADNANKADLASSYMNSICNKLDEVIAANKPAGLQNLAQAAWKKEYTAAADSASKWRTEIDGYAKFAANYAAQSKAFNTAKDSINTLNKLALATNPLINVYGGFSDNLDEQYGILDNIRKALKQSYTDNKKSKELYDSAKADVKTADGEYQAIYNYAFGLLVSDSDGVKAVRTAIDGFDSYLEANSAVLYQKEDELKAKKQVMVDAVKGGYEDVKTAVIDLLKGTMLKDVKDSYNKKVAAGGWNVDEQAKAEAAINAYADQIETLKADKVDNDANRAAFQTKVENLEASISELNSQLNPEQYPAAALNQLNASYDAAEKVLANAETYLRNCAPEVKDKYATTYPPLRSKLEAIKEAYQNEGAKVTYVVDVYEAQIKDVEAKVVTENDKVKKSQANQVAYNPLNKDLTKYETEFNDLATTVTGLIAADERTWLDFMLRNRIVTEENGKYVVLPTLSAEINSTKTTLSNEYKAENVPAKAQDIRNDLNAIENALLPADYIVRLQRAANELAPAKEAIKYANDSITSVENELVPETFTALMAEVYTLESTYDKKATLIDQLKNQDPNLSNAIKWKNLSDLKNAYNDLVGIIEKANGLVASVGENKVVPGNVDLDPTGTVNVIDVQMVADWVGNNTTYQDLYLENARQAMAADVNHDTKLNIADVTGVIGYANPSQATAAAVLMGSPMMQTANGNLTLRLVSEENNVRRYAVCLSSDIAFIGGQLDIHTAPGARVSLAEAGERSNGHEFHLYDNGDFSRLLVYSMENAAFRGDSGVIGFVEIEGEGKLTVDNIIFSDENSTGHDLSETGVSGVDDIIDSFKNGVKSIYNAAGQKFNKLQKGINIIRHEDGTTTKEIKKN